MKVVICGGGIMSACTTHYLVKNGASCEILERDKVACAASGKAGGFLAKDWCGSSPLASFAASSFKLHSELSTELNGKDNYDYRRLKAFSLDLNPTQKQSKQSSLSWVDGNGVDSKDLREIGSTNTVAHLHPFKFATTLMKHNVEKGLVVREREEVVSIKFSHDRKKVKGVKLASGEIVQGYVVILAMGPWTGIASKWFSKVPSVYRHKAHSITVRPSLPVPAEALFTECGEYSPELYPRPDGEVYICGMAENPIPSHSLVTSDNVAITPGSCEKIKELSDLVSSHIKDGVVTCSQACYLPITSDGLPLIGGFADVSGLYIAAGHGCWGILCSPATGKALAETIMFGHSDIDINAFDPCRFDT